MHHHATRDLARRGSAHQHIKQAFLRAPDVERDHLALSVSTRILGSWLSHGPAGSSGRGALMGAGDIIGRGALMGRGPLTGRGLLKGARGGTNRGGLKKDT